MTAICLFAFFVNSLLQPLTLGYIPIMTLNVRGSDSEAANQ
jgi:hypothetical protein